MLQNASKEHLTPQSAASTTTPSPSRPQPAVTLSSIMKLPSIAKGVKRVGSVFRRKKSRSKDSASIVIDRDTVKPIAVEIPPTGSVHIVVKEVQEEVKHVEQQTDSTSSHEESPRSSHEESQSLPQSPPLRTESPKQESRSLHEESQAATKLVTEERDVSHGETRQSADEPAPAPEPPAVSVAAADIIEDAKADLRKPLDASWEKVASSSEPVPQKESMESDLSVPPNVDQTRQAESALPLATDAVFPSPIPSQLPHIPDSQADAPTSPTLAPADSAATTLSPKSDSPEPEPAASLQPVAAEVESSSLPASPPSSSSEPVPVVSPPAASSPAPTAADAESPAPQSTATKPPPSETPRTPQTDSSIAASPPAPLNVNKDVPPSPPLESESEQEEEAPEVVAPALTNTTMFLPIPNTDPLTSLLIKHVPEPHLRPPRDVSGDWHQTDFHTLVMTNNWRALARMARDRIVSASPTDIELILGLWYVRLSSLARMRLFNQCSAECDNLFTALSAIEPPPARKYIFESVLPFELEVLRARCVYWSGDPIAYLDELSALLRRCRSKARTSRQPTEWEMWKERGARMCLIIASQLIEMKDHTAAAALLEPLCVGPTASPAFRSAIARIYLQGGYIAMAAKHFFTVERDPSADASVKAMNAILLAAVEGDWAVAAQIARDLIESEADNVLATNNYAVALLSQGRLKEGIEVMEAALRTSPSAVTVAEPYLFNLSTLYELRSAFTLSKKRDLLIEVAKWSGDGLRPTCLKMPTS